MSNLKKIRSAVPRDVAHGYRHGQHDRRTFATLRCESAPLHDRGVIKMWDSNGGVGESWCLSVSSLSTEPNKRGSSKRLCNIWGFQETGTSDWGLLTYVCVCDVVTVIVVVFLVVLVVVVVVVAAAAAAVERFYTNAVVRCIKLISNYFTL